MKIARFRDLNDPFELQAVNVGYRKEFRRTLKEWKAQLNERKGLLCFSEHWRNPVLWSHYADKHRGMCLGYEVNPKLVQSVTYVAERVKYPIDEKQPIDSAPKLVPLALVESADLRVKVIKSRLAFKWFEIVKNKSIP